MKRRTAQGRPPATPEPVAQTRYYRSIMPSPVLGVHDVVVDVIWPWMSFLARETKDCVVDIHAYLCSVSWKDVRIFLRSLTVNKALGLLYQITQILGSLFDVGLDILVCLRFYSQQRYNLFYMSLAVFAIAQIAYAFCFLAMYGRDRDSMQQLKCFLCALPLSQLFPLFVWIETFHLPRLTKVLTYLELSPTTFAEADEDNGKRKPSEGYVKLSEQFMVSNVGFILEAVVEAIPQSLIQTAALVHYGETDYVIIASIMTSVFVIVSKSFLFAVSVDTRTSLWNVMCVQADITGLFACMIWTFGKCSGDSSALGTNPHWVYAQFYDLAYTTSTSVVFTLFSYLLFLALQNTLVYWLEARGRWTKDIYVNGDAIWFEVWFILFLLWLIISLPLCLAVIGCQLCACAFWVLETAGNNDSHDVLYPAMQFIVHGGNAEFLPWRLEEYNHLVLEMNENFRLQNTANGMHFIGMSLEERMREHIRTRVPLMPESTLDTARKKVQPYPYKYTKPTKQDVDVENKAWGHRLMLWFLWNGCDPSLRPNSNNRSVHMDAVPESFIPRQALFMRRRWKELLQDTSRERFVRLAACLSIAAWIGSGLYSSLHAVPVLLLVHLIPFFGPVHWYLTGPPLTESKEAILGLAFSFVHIVSLLVALIHTPHVLWFARIVRNTMSPDFLKFQNLVAVTNSCIVDEARKKYLRRRLRRNFVLAMDDMTNMDATRKVAGYLNMH